jgi:hypothetical protein
VASVISGPIPSPGRRVMSYESFLETALRLVATFTGVRREEGVKAEAVDKIDATVRAVENFMITNGGVKLDLEYKNAY